MYSPAPASGFVLDQNAYESLKSRARQSPGQAEEEVARQFESLFVQMMLKRMRETTFKSGLFDTQQTEMLQSIADEQLALSVSQQGGLGLAEMLMQQMQRFVEARERAAALANGGELPESAMGAQAASLEGAGTNRSGGSQLGLPALPVGARVGEIAGAHGLPARSAAGAVGAGGVSRAAGVLQAIRQGAQTAARHAADLGRRATETPAHVEHFVRRLGEAAENVAQATGLPVKLILAQAALESGWGRQEIRHPNGLPSYNLFGIKASGGWQGGTAEVLTTEYVDGEAQRLKQSFRAYRSYEEGLHDYARLISENPRYRKVLEARNEVEAAHRVQAAGYATDPRYAEKLIAVMQQLPY